MVQRKLIRGGRTAAWARPGTGSGVRVGVGAVSKGWLGGVARRRVFVLLGHGDLVFPDEPAAEVDQLAAVATERERPHRLPGGGCGDGLFAGGATHGRQRGGSRLSLLALSLVGRLRPGFTLRWRRGGGRLGRCVFGGGRRRPARRPARVAAPGGVWAGS